MQSRCVSQSRRKGRSWGVFPKGRVLEGVARKGGMAIIRIFSLSGYILVCSKRSDLLHTEPWWKSAVTFHNGLEFVDG